MIGGILSQASRHQGASDCDFLLFLSFFRYYTIYFFSALSLNIQHSTNCVHVMAIGVVIINQNWSLGTKNFSGFLLTSRITVYGCGFLMGHRTAIPQSIERIKYKKTNAAAEPDK